MIYSDADILDAVQSGEIEITPGIRDEQIQPASLDVRMGKSLVDVGSVKTTVLEEGEEHEIVPYRLYLGETLDHVTISNNITAQLAGRSSFGREGLVVHLTAGWVDPGWSGRLTMEMVNFGPRPIRVNVGERVAQLVFEETLSPSTGYDGRYQNAERVEGTKRRQ